jgi:anti-sigma factor RsiW
MNLLSEPMTCKELVEIVTDYLEGQLSRGERARFEQHVAACEDCTIYFDQIRRITRAGALLADTFVAREALAPLLTAFRGWKQGAA